LLEQGFSFRKYRRTDRHGKVRKRTRPRTVFGQERVPHREPNSTTVVAVTIVMWLNHSHKNRY